MSSLVLPLLNSCTISSTKLEARSVQWSTVQLYFYIVVRAIALLILITCSWNRCRHAVKNAGRPLLHWRNSVVWLSSAFSEIGIKILSCSTYRVRTAKRETGIFQLEQFSFCRSHFKYGLPFLSGNRTIRRLFRAL